VQVSPHFSLEELTHSATADALKMSNVPDAKALANLTELCVVALEPLRALWGVPVTVSSGYRSPAVNLCVGGVKRSAHMDGRAADLVPQMPLRLAYEEAVASAVPYDQIIIEEMASGARWIHVAIAPPGEKPRRQAMSATDKRGVLQYQRHAEG
jgi:zinc D-Ala-D-Ala carboxypeptidase